MQQSEDSKPDFPRAQESVAPGNIDMSVRILAAEDDSTEMVYRVIIEKIHGYGMGTRPIPEGTEIFVSISKNKIHSKADLREKFAAKDKLLRMTVSGQEQMMQKQTKQILQIRKIN